MKEIFETLNTRIKSPIFGYFVFAWLALNWAQLFELVLEDRSAVDRVTTFKQQTSFVGLFVLPSIVSFGLALTYPWVNYLFLKLCQKPTDLRNTLQAESENTLLLKKLEYENARQELMLSKETNLIEQAKRDQEIRSIQDNEVREKLQNQIDELRDKFGKNNSLSIKDLPRLEPLEKDDSTVDSKYKDIQLLANQLRSMGQEAEANELLLKLANDFKSGV